MPSNRPTSSSSLRNASRILIACCSTKRITSVLFPSRSVRRFIIVRYMESPGVSVGLAGGGGGAAFVVAVVVAGVEVEAEALPLEAIVLLGD